VNILIIYSSPWWNAAAYYTLHLVKSLIFLKHNVIFAGDKNSPAAKNISNLDINVHDIDLFVNSPVKFYKNIKTIKRIILSKKINVIMPVSAPGHIICGILRKISGLKIPVIKVCLDNIAPANNILNKYLHNKLTEYFIFPGYATQKRYDKIFKISDSKILHAPLDVEKFIEFKSNINLKKELNIPEDKKIISFIGRFSPEKGVYFLLEVIKNTLKRTNNVLFILSGSEEQIKYKEVKDLLDEKNIKDYVKILPKMDDVRELINITDVGILSSRYSEYICRIALEFMAFKKPIVAPDLNVIPEIVLHEKTGYIYEKDDSLMAAVYLQKLIENDLLNQKFGKYGFERLMDNYSLEIFVKEINNILNKIS